MDPYVASLDPLEVSLVGAAVCYSLALVASISLVYETFRKKENRKSGPSGIRTEIDKRYEK